VQGFKEVALPWYSDQVLPFDITLAAANEYGAAASCKIFGVEILNEGFGSSIDDSVLEQQATFVVSVSLAVNGFFRAESALYLGCAPCVTTSATLEKPCQETPAQACNPLQI
jgi:hypothetical protein